MDRRTVRGRHPQRSRGRLAGVSSVWRTGPWGPPLAAEITPLPGSTATPSTSLFIATHFAPRRRRVPFLPRGSRGHRHGSTSPPGHRGPPRIAALRRRVATLPRSFGRDVSSVSWRTRYPGRKKDIYGRRARRKGGSRPVHAPVQRVVWKRDYLLGGIGVRPETPSPEFGASWFQVFPESAEVHFGSRLLYTSRNNGRGSPRWACRDQTQRTLRDRQPLLPSRRAAAHVRVWEFKAAAARTRQLLTALFSPCEVASQLVVQMIYAGGTRVPPVWAGAQTIAGSSLRPRGTADCGFPCATSSRPQRLWVASRQGRFRDPSHLAQDESQKVQSAHQEDVCAVRSRLQGLRSA